MNRECINPTYVNCNKQKRLWLTGIDAKAGDSSDYTTLMQFSQWRKKNLKKLKPISLSFSNLEAGICIKLGLLPGEILVSNFPFL